MTKLVSGILCVALGVALTLPAYAQSAATSAPAQQQNIGAVNKLTGSVMLSNQQTGAFAPAALSENVVSGQRLMVASNSTTTIKYNNGCEQTFDKAGVYDLDESACKAVLWPVGGKIVYAAMTGGLIYGIIHNTNNHSRTPISR